MSIRNGRAVSMHSDFEELLSIFNGNEIKYLIVGGHAVMLYTEPHASWIDRSLLCDQNKATAAASSARRCGRWSLRSRPHRESKQGHRG
jgi:hypothetical protein